MAQATTRHADRDALTAVLRAAPIRDAVLIGSAVYAPEAARDLDIVVTADRTDDAAKDALWEALESTTGYTVDLILRQPGEEIGNLAMAILAGEVLAGNGETAQEARTFFEKAGGFVNAFEQAEASLRSADRNFSWAANEKRSEDRVECYKSAFDKLFHAARIAALCYLGRDTTGWGGLPQVLPPPFGQQFKAMVDTLHVQYSYEGRIPQGREASEFVAWKQRAREFVAAMRQRVLKREGNREGPER